VFPEIGIDLVPEIQPTDRTGDEPLRVLFAGRLLGWKGAHLAIRAVADARQHGTPIDFTLVGRGPYEAELRRLAKCLGMEEAIRWIPQMPQQELFGLYRTMHCFLFPSLHDSSGNVVLEAQANGLPVICLGVGGPATLVTAESAIVIPADGGEGEVVGQISQALSRLFSDEARRREMAGAARRHAETFTWSGRALGALATVLPGSAPRAGTGILENS